MKLESFSDEFDKVKLASGVNFKDQRGILKKTMYGDELSSLINPIKEVITSTSKKNVIRGLHYQKEPKQIKKFVTCVYGEIIDTFVNIDTRSENYKKFGQIKLSAEDDKAILIPEYFAHGYSVISDIAIIVYLQSDNYDPELDSGFNPLSLGIDWKVKSPIISEKDLAFQKLS